MLILNDILFLKVTVNIKLNLSKITINFIEKT